MEHRKAPFAHIKAPLWFWSLSTRSQEFSSKKRGGRGAYAGLVFTSGDDHPGEPHVAVMSYRARQDQVCHRQVSDWRAAGHDEFGC